ncbi:MAG: hypothetical protein MZV70_40790 [Desulfobacterales bacterium]|nr:hypothetical protein [Desulfobacterales bacterium]
MLVEKGLVERLSGGGSEPGLRSGAQREPPRPSAFPLPQLRGPAVPAARQPQGGPAGHRALLSPVRFKGVEVRVDGICTNCLKKALTESIGRIRRRHAVCEAYFVRRS